MRRLLVLAAVLRASRQMRHPVQVVLDHVGHLAIIDGALDKLNPLRVLRLELGVEVGIPIHAAEAELKRAGLVLAVRGSP